MLQAMMLMLMLFSALNAGVRASVTAVKFVQLLPQRPIFLILITAQMCPIIACAASTALDAMAQRFKVETASRQVFNRAIKHPRKSQANCVGVALYRNIGVGY